MSTSKNLTIKDYAVVGIYSLLVVALQFALGMVTSPFILFNFVFFCGPVSFLSAPIYLLMASKVGKPGVLIIFNVVRGLMFLAMGAPLLMVWLLVGAVISELVMRRGDGYMDSTNNAVAWTISSIFYGLHLVFMVQVSRSLFAAMLGEEMMALTLVYLTSPMWIVVNIVTVTVFAWLGIVFANRLMSKHFKRSGIIN